MPDVTIQKTSYRGWQNCIRLSNDHLDLVITTDVGPRIIRCGFIGGPNLLGEIESTLGKTGGDEWRIYGGHRLWHSPEHPVRTYVPDNGPVQWEEIENGVRTIQDTEPLTNIRKVMEISLSPGAPVVDIRHKLKNTGLWPATLSVWCITVMAKEGLEVIPLNRRDTGLLPNGNLSIWPYTRLNDPRLRLGEKYIYLKQDPSIERPFKIGTANESGWAAYFVHDSLFIKMYRHEEGAAYPDFGVSYETYTNDFMLEMESLSPLATIEAGARAEHAERWMLVNDIPEPPIDDDHITRILSPHLKTYPLE
jgi:hypothetical protein